MARQGHGPEPADRAQPQAPRRWTATTSSNSSGCHLEQRPVPDDAGVVHEQVDPAERRSTSGRPSSSHTARSATEPLTPDRGAALRGDRRLDLADPARVGAVDDDARTVGGQVERDRPPEPLVEPVTTARLPSSIIAPPPVRSTQPAVLALPPGGCVRSQAVEAELCSVRAADGAELRYEMAGDGPPIVLVHQQALSSRTTLRSDPPGRPAPARPQRPAGSRGHRTGPSPPTTGSSRSRWAIYWRSSTKPASSG